MKIQIETLKRDIEIHKEVEKELAKRSHFCQKVIKRLKNQIKDLETEKTELQKGKGGMKTSAAGTMKNSLGNSPLKGGIPGDDGK